MRDSILRWYLRTARHPLKEKLVGHYWRWFCNRPYWVTYEEDLTIKLFLNDYIQQTIFYKGVYEPLVVNTLKTVLVSDDVFWDVGANVGVMTLIAAKRCKQVVAFEPEPTARLHLEEHLAKNRIHNVIVVPYALAAYDGIAKLHLGPDSNSGMHSLRSPRSDKAAISVQTARADTVIKSLGIPSPNVMKIDVEGAELMVLEGAVQILHDTRLRVIIFESAENKDSDLASNEIRASLLHAGLIVSNLGRSDPGVDDGLSNFLAFRSKIRG